MFVEAREWQMVNGIWMLNHWKYLITINCYVPDEYHESICKDMNDGIFL